MNNLMKQKYLFYNGKYLIELACNFFAHPPPKNLHIYIYRLQIYHKFLFIYFFFKPPMMGKGSQ